MKKSLYILAMAGVLLQSCNAQTVKDPTAANGEKDCLK